MPQSKTEKALKALRCAPSRLKQPVWCETFLIWARPRSPTSPSPLASVCLGYAPNRLISPPTPRVRSLRSFFLVFLFPHRKQSRLSLSGGVESTLEMFLEARKISLPVYLCRNNVSTRKPSSRESSSTASISLLPNFVLALLIWLLLCTGHWLPFKNPSNSLR